jgi:DNA repair protein RecO (recombination protein O)
MPLYSSEAIVLRRIDYREADRIVTFLTPDHGKVSGLARGVKRIRSRFGASLESLTYGKLVYFDRQGKNLISINHFDILKSFQQIRENLIRSCSCQYIAELVMQFVPEKEAAAEVFTLFLETLEGMTRSQDSDAILRIFEIRLLILIGYAPRVDACVLCGESEDISGISISEGGVVCPSCKGRAGEVRPISEGALFFWKQAPLMTSGHIDRVRLQKRLNNELKQILHRYFLYLLGREIRSYNFLEQVNKVQHG